ncbi:GumC domain-containing protein [Mesoterricola sediminis]|nr:hypothetical protein [Mesoterricola sediminis]
MCPLLAACAAGLAAAAAGLALPNRYAATARILPDLGTAAASGRTGVWAPTAPPALPGSREEGPTVIFVEILHSRRVADRVLGTTFAYRDRTWALGAPVARREPLWRHLGARDPEGALGPFRRALGVDRNPRSGLLTLTAETRSPELSLQVVQAAVEALRETLQDLTRAEARWRADVVQRRLDEVEAAHREASGRFRRFLEANRNWEASPSPDLRFQGLQLREQVDLLARVRANLTLNREQALLEAGGQAPALHVLDGGALPLRKRGPHRALLVLGAAALAGGAATAVQHRGRIHHLIFAREHA